MDHDHPQEGRAGGNHLEARTASTMRRHRTGNPQLVVSRKVTSARLCTHAPRHRSGEEDAHSRASARTHILSDTAERRGVAQKWRYCNATAVPAIQVGMHTHAYIYIHTYIPHDTYIHTLTYMHTHASHRSAITGDSPILTTHTHTHTHKVCF